MLLNNQQIEKKSRNKPPNVSRVEQWRHKVPVLMGGRNNISKREVSEVKKRRKISRAWATSKVLKSSD